MLKYFLVLTILWTFFSSTQAQTPPKLTSNISFDVNTAVPGLQGDFIAVIDIQAGFNNARRAEEKQFCIPTNSIKNLQMPFQSVWNAMSIDEKFLFLLNDERKARAGLNYCNGEGNIVGLPFTGVDLSIDQIAQNEANYLVAQQTLQTRALDNQIDANPNIGGSGCNAVAGVQPNCCHSALKWSVISVYFRSEFDPPNPSLILTEGIEAKSVYYWIYGNGVSNKRTSVLLQNKESNASPIGFINDNGSAFDEGYIGIGIASGKTAPGSNFKHIDFVIMSYFDPIPSSAGCNYICTTCEPCPSTLFKNEVPIAAGEYEASFWIQSAGAVMGNSNVDMSAGSFIQLNPNFEVKKGSIYNAGIASCN